MPYRTVGQKLVAYLDDLVREVQRKRFEDQPQPTRPQAPVFWDILRSLEAFDLRAIGLLTHGDRIYFERDPFARRMVLTVCAGHHRVVRPIGEVDIAMLDETGAVNAIGDLITDADAELGRDIDATSRI